MRETFKLFQRRVPDGKIPGPLLKLFLQHILLGLDYLHSECSIVHTGEEAFLGSMHSDAYFN